MEATGVSAREAQGADDETLALAAQQGDHVAFGELYKRYRPVFVSYAAPRLGHSSQDVIQTVFVSILKGLRSYRGPRFFPWAYRILANSVTDELRRRGRQAELLPAEGLDSEKLRSPQPSPEALVDARRLSQSISRAVDQLPRKQRTVFVLARFEGLEYAEISDLLGIPQGTVKSRMFAAVRAVFPASQEFK